MNNRDPKLRILVATGIYPPDIGGPATYTRLLERELPKHDIEVAVCSFSHFKETGRFQHLSYARALWSKAKDADVVFALDPATTGAIASLVSRLQRKRFFVRIGGDYAWEMASLQYGVRVPPHEYVHQVKTYPTKIKALRKRQYRVAAHADRVFTQSEYLKSVIAAWGMPDTKIKVIPNGFRAPEELAEKSLLRGMMHLEGGTVALSAGRMIPLKRFDNLISIVPKILSQHPDFRLIIVGDGEERGRLEALVADLNLEEHVSLTGALEHNVLLRYMKAADICILNSEHETFPNFIIEAMALGTPVIANRVGGIPEIVEHDKSGQLIELGDDDALEEAMLRYISDTSYTEYITKTAHESVAAFSIEAGIGALVKELLV